MIKITDYKSLKRSVRKWFPVYLENLKIDLKLETGQQKYTRFVILGRSRTGSNFLKGLLNSHSNVVTYGELFRGWDRENVNGKKDIMRYLLKRIFRTYSSTVKAVGFKLFYYHAHNKYNEALWTYLKENRDIKIIHITRDNMLKTLLSRLKADKTDTWAISKAAKAKQLRDIITFEECRKDFEWTQGLEKEYREVFRKHKVFELVYEDLEKDPQGEINKILNFLGLPHQTVIASTIKQRKENLRDSIYNYDRLRKKFVGTKWERFFEDAK